MNRALGSGLVLGLAVLIVAPGAYVRHARSAGREVTVTGTVIDMACRFSKGQTGPSHVACAIMCAKAGVPLAILTSDGTLYIPAAHGEGQNPKLLPFVEQEVTVTGNVFPAAGANTIEIAAIAKKS